MTKKSRVQLSDQWRDGIKAGLLIKRLYDNSMGDIELTQSQIKSTEILLRKMIPDLKAIEVTGKDGGAIEVKNISENDKTIIERFFNQKKEVK